MIINFNINYLYKINKVNSFGACVRDPETRALNTMDVDGGSNKKSEKVVSSLSIDRAAFLILRVKKAFKKKRQQRKDKQ